MTEVHIFVTTLTRAEKGRQEIQLLVESACGEKNVIEPNKFRSLFKVVKDKNNQNDEKDHGLVATTV